MPLGHCTAFSAFGGQRRMAGIIVVGFLSEEFSSGSDRFAALTRRGEVCILDTLSHSHFDGINFLFIGSCVYRRSVTCNAHKQWIEHVQVLTCASTAVIVIEPIDIEHAFALAHLHSLVLSQACVAYTHARLKPLAIKT